MQFKSGPICNNRERRFRCQQSRELYKPWYKKGMCVILGEIVSTCEIQLDVKPLSPKSKPSAKPNAQVTIVYAMSK